MSRLRGIAGEANGPGSAATHVTIKDASRLLKVPATERFLARHLYGRLLIGTKAGRNLHTRKLGKGEKLGKA